LSTGGLKGFGTVLGKLLEHNTDGSLTDKQLFFIAIHLLIAGKRTTIRDATVRVDSRSP